MASGDTRKVILKNKDDEYLIPYTEVASSTTVGRVKPDGTTTSVDSNGAMSVIGKQDTLVSGTNIKTVNGNSLLGSGNVTIGAQVSYGNITGTLSDQTDLQDALDAKANDSDVVKLTGNQTIAGTKTFTNPVYCINNSAYNHNMPGYTNGTVPSTNYYPNTIILNDSAGQYFGFYGPEMLTDGSYSVRMGVRSQVDNTKYSILKVGCLPDGTFYTSAPTPATSDNSTKIATTANVDAKITAQAVKLTGNQTIAGVKTFTDNIRIETSSVEKDIISKNTTLDLTQSSRSSNVYSFFRINDKNNNIGGSIGFAYGTTGISKALLEVRNKVTGTLVSGQISINVDSSGNIYTSAPTPATADNSTKIATTAFVKNNFQVVTALPANPVAGVFYFVKE